MSAVGAQDPFPTLGFLLQTPDWVGHLETDDPLGLPPGSAPAVELSFRRCSSLPGTLEAVEVTERVWTPRCEALLRESQGRIWTLPRFVGDFTVAAGYALIHHDGLVEISRTSTLDGWGLRLEGALVEPGDEPRVSPRTIQRVWHLSPGPEGVIGGLSYSLLGTERPPVFTWLAPKSEILDRWPGWIERRPEGQDEGA